MSRLPAEWLPYALHRVFVPELHNLSTLTGLTQLIIQRAPGVCVLIEALSTLTGLEVLSAIGVEHSGDALRELGSYLSKFKNLQRLELNIQPLGAAAHAAVGSQGRGSHSAYGFYARPGRAGSDAMEETEHQNGICAVELAGTDFTVTGACLLQHGGQTCVRSSRIVTCSHCSPVATVIANSSLSSR